jgi:hypothetical protein
MLRACFHSSDRKLRAMNEGCCSVRIEGVGKDESADERERAIE